MDAHSEPTERHPPEVLRGAAIGLRVGRFRDRRWAVFVAVSGQFRDRLRAESHDRRHPYPSGPLRDPASSKPRWEPPGKRGVASHCHHSVARSWTGAGIRAAPDGDRRHKDRGAAAATSPDLRRGVPSPARRREPHTGTRQFKSSRCLTEESPGARPATAEVVTIHHHIPQPLGGRTDLLGTAGRPIQVLRSAPSEAIAAQPTR